MSSIQLFTDSQDREDRRAEVIAEMEARLDRVGNLMPRKLTALMRKSIAKYHVENKARSVKHCLKFK